MVHSLRLISLAELKERFPVQNVPPYGECVIVPGDKFDPDWEAFLDEQGYGCLFTDLGEKPVTLVLTKKRQPEPPTPQPPRKYPSAMKGPAWSSDDENRLIRRMNELTGPTEARCGMLTKEFQGRSAMALVQKFKKLVKASRVLPGKRGRPKKAVSLVLQKDLDKTLENVCSDCGLPKDLCCCDEEKKESLKVAGPFYSKVEEEPGGGFRRIPLKSCSKRSWTFSLLSKSLSPSTIIAENAG